MLIPDQLAVADRVFNQAALPSGNRLLEVFKGGGLNIPVHASGRTVPQTSSDVLFNVVWTVNKEGLIPIMGYVVYGIPAFSARIQMVQHIQLLI